MTCGCMQSGLESGGRETSGALRGCLCWKDNLPMQSHWVRYTLWSSCASNGVCGEGRQDLSIAEVEGDLITRRCSSPTAIVQGGRDPA